MNKEIKFNKEAREKIKKGADILANSVKVTLGPKGRNVVIEQDYKAPRITKDGVSVAKEINLEDPFENIGAQLVKEVAAKMGDSVGDGTTTATVLAQYILDKGFELIADNKISPVDLKKGIDMATTYLVSCIHNYAVPIYKDFNKISEIATISANNDKNIGKLVAEALKNAGDNGVVTVDESDSSKTYITKVSGVQYKRGYLDKLFINTPDNDSCEFENTILLLYNGKLESIQCFVDIFDYAYSHSKSVLIIANSFSEEVKQGLILNKINKQFKVCAINTPGRVEDKPTNLMDLAALTNSKIVTPNDSKYLTVDDISTVKRIKVTSTTTTIVSKKCDEVSKNALIQEIKQELKDTEDTAYLKERLARLDGNISVINVGALSEMELNEKKDRIEDALCAAKSAIEEGIVEGGGLTYLKLKQDLNKYSFHCSKDVAKGVKLISSVLEIPFKQICLNAGVKYSTILKKIKKNNYVEGYNAKTDKIESLSKSGIVDPAKVTRCALENAASIAGLFLTTECVITNKRINP